MMSATVALAEQHALEGLKDFLIFRVDEAEGRQELSRDSALEGEAVRYARLMARADPAEDIHYEVRECTTGALLYSTGDPDDESEETTWTPTDSIPAATL